MKIVNRGYIIVRPKKAFMDWANQNDEDFEDLQDAEANIYLTEEDFYEDEPIIKASFKKIFMNELKSVTEDKTVYPEMELDVFRNWFEVELGSMVFDMQKEDLKAD